MNCCWREHTVRVILRYASVCLSHIWNKMFTSLWPWFTLWNIHSHVFSPGLVILHESITGWGGVIMLTLQMQIDNWVMLFCYLPLSLGLFFQTLFLHYSLFLFRLSYVIISSLFCLLVSRQHTGRPWFFGTENERLIHTDTIFYPSHWFWRKHSAFISTNIPVDITVKCTAVH